MTKVTMPEAVAWTVTVGSDFKNCIEITHCKDDAVAQYEASTEGGFESLYEMTALHTAAQMEGYATARVREALEEAASMVSNCHPHATHRGIAAAIRVLIPQHDNK